MPSCGWSWLDLPGRIVAGLLTVATVVGLIPLVLAMILGTLLTRWAVRLGKGRAWYESWDPGRREQVLADAWVIW